MNNDDSNMAALERAVEAMLSLMSGFHNTADAALIRAHIETLRAGGNKWNHHSPVCAARFGGHGACDCVGGERAQIVAQIVAYVDDYDPTMADAINERFAAGAHVTTA